MPGHHFISFSASDSETFAIKLADDLQAGPPPFPVWIFRRELHASSSDWDAQLRDAIRECDSLIFVMSRDSVTDESNCKLEWTAALKYKKPILLVRLHSDAEAPFRIASRQYVDFTGDYKVGLAKLRKDLQWLHEPRGELQALKLRFADAERDLRRASDAERPRVLADLELLRKQIAEQTEALENPQAAAKRTEASIAAGLEGERAPAEPVSRKSKTKFINPPPATAPRYFQNRFEENILIRDFLNDDAKRALTIIGRAGIGKTAMVCRLLKSLESGQLPYDLGMMSVDGIVYLSAIGTRNISTTNLYTDLCRSLPADIAQKLDALYRDPKPTIHDKMLALLERFPSGRVIILLDNFENVIDSENNCCVKDTELDEALRGLLNAPHHAVKLILTTRVAPHDLNLVQAGRQSIMHLDAGLESPYAENVLRECDVDGKVGLKNAPDELLSRARERTRGFPRALEALYAILAADRYTSLEEILDWHPERSVEGPESKGAHTSTTLRSAQEPISPLPENVVDALVGEAFNRLDPTAQRVMEGLAVYPQPVPPPAVDYLLQPYLPSIDSAPVLNRLVNMQFAHKESGRYFLHPADRAYAWSCIPGEFTLEKQTNHISASVPAMSLRLKDFSQKVLLNRAANYFHEARKPRETWKMIDDLAPLLTEFDLRCAAEDFDKAASVLLEIDGEYLLVWGHFRLMIQMHERLRGKLNDPTSRRLNVSRMGLALAAIGQVQRAINCYEEALAISRENKDRRGEGVSLGNLGTAYSNLGESRRAIAFFEQALAIARETGNKSLEGNWLGTLGYEFGELCEIHRAIPFYEQALAIAREIGDKRSEGRWLSTLGSAFSDLGETHRAIEFFGQALTIACEIGDKRGESVRVCNLGIAFAHLGETQRAVKYFERSLAIAREIEDRFGEGYRLMQLARIMIDQEHYTQAIQQLLEIVKTAEEIGSPRLTNLANTTLALAYLYTGDQSAARAAAETAGKYDVPENNHNVAALLGVIALRQNDTAVAQEAFTDAIQHADKLLTQTSEYYEALDAKGIALCGLALGLDDGQERTEQTNQAVETFRAARAISKDAGVVARIVRLLETLALANPNGSTLLAEARKAAGAL